MTRSQTPAEPALSNRNIEICQWVMPGNDVLISSVESGAGRGIGAAVGSPMVIRGEASNGDQTSNKKPGYIITQTGRVSAVAPRRCQGAAADGAGRGLRRMVV